MKKIWYLCTLLSLSAPLAQAQLNAHPEAYKIDKKDIKRAHELISTPVKQPLVLPNPNPDAQWFPDASLGAVHALGHSQRSRRTAFMGHDRQLRMGRQGLSADKYYALAERFNPQDYDPNKYLKAAKDAGFTYAVLTTKHHDGYALWPSKYGIGTKQYMNGRDLLKEYVDACRANGLKVGFYFSPRRLASIRG